MPDPDQRLLQQLNAIHGSAMITGNAAQPVVALPAPVARNSNGVAVHPAGDRTPAQLFSNENKAPTARQMQQVAQGRVWDGKNWVSQDAAINQFDSFTKKEGQNFKTALQLAGYDTTGLNAFDLQQVWTTLVHQAAKNPGMSPMDLLNADYFARKNGQGAGTASHLNLLPQGYNGPGGGGGGGYGGGGGGGAGGSSSSSQQSLSVSEQTHYDHSKTVDYTDPTTARTIINGAWQQLMGRDPSNAEIKQFTKALYTYEKKHPAESSTTSTNKTVSTTNQVSQGVSDGMGGSQSQSKTGSVDKSSSNTSTTQISPITEAGVQQLAIDQAKGTKEYGSVQAATTYMDALRKLVNGG